MSIDKEYDEPIFTERIRYLLNEGLLKIEDPVLNKYLCYRHCIESEGVKYICVNPDGLLGKLIKGKKVDCLSFTEDQIQDGKNYYADVYQEFYDSDAL